MGTIDELRSEYKNMKAKPMAVFPDGEQPVVLDTLIRALKMQANSDRNYLLYRKILPVSIGIVLLTIVFILTRPPNMMILSGCILVYTGLLSILVLFIRDYILISKEDFGVSIIEHLSNKRLQIKRWRRIPVLYNMIYGFYIVGVLFFILGNTGLEEIFRGSRFGIMLYSCIIIGTLVLSGIIGELKHRSRFKREHQPVIHDITQLLNELKSEVISK